MVPARVVSVFIYRTSGGPADRPMVTPWETAEALSGATRGFEVGSFDGKGYCWCRVGDPYTVAWMARALVTTTTTRAEWGGLWANSLRPEALHNVGKHWQYIQSSATW